ncbi:Disease resistance protein RPM1 [Morus notabilis]|uniref:Disease resistance protein RPM1 n=1 Tax=Morus notabilis TaxID=981085 RepID=W9S5H4_9ROSA|nr:disease resistance protein RPM1 [Morus notabilis]EXB89763.1 Disease resistance protein RPM1 [Morus notabilis]
MAETAVCSLIDKLIPLLAEEVNLLRGVHGEVSEINRELVFIRAFLKDADQKAEVEGDIGDGVKAWVEELREVALKIEDVIDVYIYHMTINHPDRHRFIAFLSKIACFVTKLKPQHHIATQIREIKETIRGIKDRSTRYGFDSLQQTPMSDVPQRWNDPRRAAYFLREADVVGIESPRNELIEILKTHSPERIVISIVGIGGSGKTTLAKQVYNYVKRDFDCHAWITVSEPYSAKELLRNLIRKVYEATEASAPVTIDTMDEQSLTEQLIKYLQNKKYFIVFDDVWYKEFWGDVNFALPENGGRMVITTRKKEVANFCKRSVSSVQVHSTEPGRCCPANLEYWSREIVASCHGLPLAIVAIAGLLSTKNKVPYEWQKFYETLRSELVNHSDLKSTTKILSLSYTDLPYYLKCCILYFGIFPKGYSIRRGRLIRQWIAEGFVKPQTNKSLEVVAKEYLFELIDKGLVEISKANDEGQAKSCRVHDLLHVVISQKMKESRFCRVLSDKSPPFEGVARRLSIIFSSDKNLQETEISGVRCLFMFNGNNEMLNSTVNALATSVKLLKVLDFEDAPCLDHLPEDIGDLFHLRYLSVRDTKVKLLPNSIGKLVNLETLDLKRSLVYEIPASINRLSKLRHLFGWSFVNNTELFSFDRIRGIKIQKIECFKHLQKLYSIEANIDGACTIEELGTLTQLRTLGIWKVRNRDGKSLCGCIEKMKYLESLIVRSIGEDETLDLDSISHPPEFLRRLYLLGPLMTLPRWIMKLQNLAKIVIRFSKFGDDPLKVLGNLHELVQLEIVDDAFVGEQLHFREGVFPKLKVLRLHGLKWLSSLIIEEGALRALEKLVLGPSPQMKEVPTGIKHLRNLKLLQFFDMADEFVASVNPNGGHSYHIVQHVVPFVFFRYADDQVYRLHDSGLQQL